MSLYSQTDNDNLIQSFEQLALATQDTLAVQHWLYLREITALETNGPSSDRLARLIESFDLLTKSDSISIGEALYKIGNTYSEVEQVHKAIEAYDQSLSIRRRVLPDDDKDLSTNLGKLGSLLIQINRLDSAYLLLSESLDIRQKLNPPQPKLVSGAYTRLGSLFMRYLDYDKSAYYLEKANDYNLKVYAADDPKMIASYLNFSSALIQQSKFNRASHYVKMAYDFIRQQENPKPLELEIARHNHAILLLKEGRAIESEALFKENLQILKDADDLGDSYTYNLSLISQALAAQEKYKEAEKYLIEAKTNIQNSKGDSSTYSFHIEEEYAQNQRLQGNLIEALAITNKVLHKKEIIYGKAHYETIYSEHLKSKILLDQGSFEKAYTLLNDLTKRIEDSEWMPFDPLHISIQMTITEMLLRSRIVSEEIIESSIAHTDSLIQKQRASIIPVIDQFIQGQQYESFYSNAVQYFSEKTILQPESKAERSLFYYMEQAKGNSLFQSLKNSFAWESQVLPQEIISKKQSIQHQLSQLKIELKQESIFLVEAEKKMKIIQLQKEYVSLLRDIEKKYPEYYDVKYQLKRLSLQDFQKRLSEDQVAINFFISKSDLIILSCNNNGYHVSSETLENSSLTCVSQLLGLIKRQENLRSVSDKKQLLQEFSTYSHCIYSTMLEDHLAKYDQTSKLLIIPHKQLNRLPYEILCTTLVEDPETFKTLPYLIKDYSVSYLYAASLPPLKNASHLKPYIGFAPSFREKGVNLGGFYDLAESRRQLVEIADKVGGIAFTGEESNLVNFNKYVDQYKIVHLSTHAEWDSVRTLDSKLWMRSEDGQSLSPLTVEDIYQLDLPGSLIVLSACQTGIGNYIQGEGPIHFSHAFKHAGANTTWMSLWSIPEESSAHIIRDGLARIEKGMSSDDAMRAAKLNYLNESADRVATPFYWGGLVTVGQTNVDTERKSYAFYVSILVILILSLLYILKPVKTFQV